jgi:hypothetical protein
VYKVLDKMIPVIAVIFLLMLIIVPLLYCMKKRCFLKVFLFTWAFWAIGWFVYGFFVPAFWVIHERATGNPQDMDGFAILIGIVVGWIPGIVFGCLGALGSYKNPLDMEEKK